MHTDALTTPEALSSSFSSSKIPNRPTAEYCSPFGPYDPTGSGLRARPEDELTVIKSFRTTENHAKSWSFDGKKWSRHTKKDRTGSGRPLKITQRIVRVENARGLFGLLKALEHSPREAILRDAPGPTALQGRNTFRRKAHFDQTPRRWFMADCDQIQAPPGLNVIDHPEQCARHAIELVSEHLPEVRGVDCVYQLSASAGLIDPRVIKIHLWFLTDTPVHSDVLVRKAKAANRSAGFDLIDPSLFHSVQLHFTAAPICQGAPDPLAGRRLGLIEGQSRRCKVAHWQQTPPIDAKPAPARSAPKPTPTPSQQDSDPHLGVCLGLEGCRRAAFARTVITNELGDVATANTARSGGSRNRRLLQASTRIKRVSMASPFGLADAEILSRLGGAATAAGLTNDIDRQIHNGIAFALSKGPARDLPPCTCPSREATRRPQAPPDFSLPALRSEAKDKTVASVKARKALLNQSDPGFGKSTLTNEVVRLFAAGGNFALCIEKDRASAQLRAEQLGALALTGKKVAPQFGPDLFGDRFNCINKEVTRARDRGLTPPTCHTCPFRPVCAKEGFIKDLDAATTALTDGGVVCATVQMARLLLERRAAALADGHTLAPIALLTLDDIKPDPCLTLAPQQLHTLLAALDPQSAPTAVAMTRGLIEQLEAATTTKPHGDHLSCPATKALLEHIDTDTLISLTKARTWGFVPVGLPELAHALDGTEGYTAHLVKGPDGGHFEIGLPPLKVPFDCPVVATGFDTQPQDIAALIGRPIDEVWRPPVRYKATGAHVQHGLFDKARWQRCDTDELVRAAQRIGAALAPAIEAFGTLNKLLLVAHKAIKDDPRYDTIIAHMLAAAGIPDVHVETIHWRGCLATGSNRFEREGFNAVFTLSDPLINLGALERRAERLRAAGLPSTTTTAVEATGHIDQAHGRARPLTNPCLLAHIGKTHKGRVLSAITDRPLPLPHKPTPTIDDAASALEAVPNRSICPTIAKHLGISRYAHRAMSDRDPRPRFEVQILGRKGRPEICIADNIEALTQDLLWVLDRARAGGWHLGKIRRLTPEGAEADEDGVGIWLFSRINIGKRPENHIEQPPKSTAPVAPACAAHAPGPAPEDEEKVFGLRGKDRTDAAPSPPVKGEEESLVEDKELIIKGLEGDESALGSLVDWWCPQQNEVAEAEEGPSGSGLVALLRGLGRTARMRVLVGMLGGVRRWPWCVLKQRTGVFVGQLRVLARPEPVKLEGVDWGEVLRLEAGGLECTDWPWSVEDELVLDRGSSWERASTAAVDLEVLPQ